MQQETHDTKSKGVALKEEFVGGRRCDILGEMKSETMVSYFKGNDPSQWRTRIPTYEIASLGEVYKGIELRLKAHGNNVEKLFCVKPGASPEQIQIRLSGIQPTELSMTGEIQPPESPFIKGDLTRSPLEKRARGLWVNEHGELVAEAALGPVKFTRPVAYQEIDGKRVEVTVEYDIQRSMIGDRESANSNKTRANKFVHATHKRNQQFEIQNPNSEIGNVYGFKVASYDRTKDLIIDPLLVSTFLGGGQMDFNDFRMESGYAIAADSSNAERMYLSPSLTMT